MQKLSVVGILLTSFSLFSFNTSRIDIVKSIPLPIETVTKLEVLFVIDNPCTAEPITVEGTIVWVNHFQVSGNRFSFTSHINYQGVSAIGLNTGKKYNFINSEIISANGDISQLPQQVVYNTTVRAISTGYAGNAIIHQQTFGTLQADGSFLAFAVTIPMVTCKG